MDERETREAIYGHERKQYLLRQRIENDNGISSRNKELIFQYWKSVVARGSSNSNCEIILQALLRVAQVSLVDFDKAERKDVEHIITELRTKKTKKNRPLSESTIATTISKIKTFWRWMCQLDSNDALPDAVKWLKSSGILKQNHLTKNDLLTKEDIIKMIDSTSDLQQKALISTHYECANRVGETLSAKIGSITFFEDYAIYSVEFGKTGKGDKTLLQSCDLLRSWVSSHPFKDDLDHPLWIITSHLRKKILPDIHNGFCWKCHKKTNLSAAKRSFTKIWNESHEQIFCSNSECGVDLNLMDKYGKPISLHYMLKIIKTAAKRAGINKRVYSYLLRHSAGTEYYKTLGEANAKQQMLHSRGSKMAGVYNHLNSEDLRDARRKAMGLVVEKEDKHNEICWKCKHPNSYNAQICSRCASPLNITAAREKKEQQDIEQRRLKKVAEMIENNPRFLDMLTKELEKEQLSH